MTTPAAAEQFSNMIGRKMTQITGAELGSESMTFHAYDGATFTFVYEPDCCARCEINDIVGDIADLIGHPIAEAELVSNDRGEGDKPSEEADSWTWSFYRFSTVKGTVTFRWLGESNGYYSETVTFSESLPSGAAS